MTDESWNLDLSNKSEYEISRHHVIKKHRYRRIGVEPPPLRNVNITVESWEAIRDLALAKGGRNSPFYDWMRILLQDYVKTLEALKKVDEELLEKQEFLDLSIQDKNNLKADIKKLEDTLLRTKYNDPAASFISESKE